MSAISDSQHITTNYLIEPNPGYDFNHKLQDAFVVQNIAEDVNYTEVSTTSTNKFHLTFEVNPANVFMDRGINLRANLPLIFTRTTAAAEEKNPADTTKNLPIDGSSYVRRFFDGYNSLAWRQLGFINAIDTITITTDGFNHTVTDVAETMKILTRYSEGGTLHEFVSASQPDFMDYNTYGDDVYHKTVPLDGSANPLTIKPAIVGPQNIFHSIGNPDYNTRTPMVTFTSAKDDRKTLHGNIVGEHCFIPLTLFGIRGIDVQPLVGVKSMSIRLTLKNAWWKHLFVTKNSFMESVKFDDAQLHNFQLTLSYRTYIPPQYIDEAHQLSQKIPDYNMKFSLCEMQNSVHAVEFTSTDIKKPINTLAYKIRAIPKSIIVCATLASDNDDDLINTPDLFTRIDGIEVDLAGKKTVLPNNPIDLMSIAKANGYQDPMEVGYYLGGFPLKLNTTDDLGGKSNALVGSRQNIQNELRLNKMSMVNVVRHGKAATYNVRLIVIYDSMLAYRNGKFILMDSLLESETGLNVEAHVSSLYNHQIQSMNMIGGSFTSVLAAAIPGLKKVGVGAFNVIKKFATDKKFRGDVINAFNGAKQLAQSAQPVPNFVEQGPSSRPANYVDTGGRFSSHSPMSGGGGYGSNVIGGNSVGSIRYV